MVVNPASINVLATREGIREAAPHVSLTKTALDTISTIVAGPVLSEWLAPSTSADEPPVGTEVVGEAKKSSMVKKFLTPELHALLKDVVSKDGATLEDVIASGTDHPDSKIGMYAVGGPDAYKAFSPLFDRIIEEYHHVKSHPHESDIQGESLPELSAAAKQRIKSVRIRCARNLDGHKMHGGLDKEGYLAIESKVVRALEGLAQEHKELKGKYHRIKDLSHLQKAEMLKAHLIPQENDKYLKSAKADTAYPEGRGSYIADDNEFMVWVNEEDQLRIIVLKNNNDIQGAWDKWVLAVGELGAKLKFARDSELGWLTFCPTNLGTALRASVHMEVPRQAADLATLEVFAGQHGIQVRGSAGEHTAAKDGVVDLSNKQRMGKTTFGYVATMIEGINEIAKKEAQLEQE